MASLNIGPVNFLPNQALHEYQYAYVNLAQTAVIVAAGAGVVHSVVIGVAGTLLKLYDTPSGGTADGTTQIATIDASAPTTNDPALLDVAFSKGLTAILTGAGELTISFRGAATVSARTFGV